VRALREPLVEGCPQGRNSSCDARRDPPALSCTRRRHRFLSVYEWSQLACGLFAHSAHPGYSGTLNLKPSGLYGLRASLCKSAFERKALRAAACPTCAPVREQRFHTGTCGWPLPESPPGVGAAGHLRASHCPARRRAGTRAPARLAPRARNVDRALLLRSHWRIAVYAALAEELDTAPLIALARERGCRI